MSTNVEKCPITDMTVESIKKGLEPGKKTNSFGNLGPVNPSGLSEGYERWSYWEQFCVEYSTDRGRAVFQRCTK